MERESFETYFFNSSVCKSWKIFWGGKFVLMLAREMIHFCTFHSSKANNVVWEFTTQLMYKIIVVFSAFAIKNILKAHRYIKA
jgi:hypothetical protein